jgi:sugar/nucleoside kinase (ribokinase family)
MDSLVDPAHRVVRDRASRGDAAAPAIPLGLRSAYLAMRASRSVLPLRPCARLVRRAAITVGARWITPGANSVEIGATVHATEDAAGAGDCYARALITAFLCLSARRACVLAVGVLAPTRKMHAWCCVEGDLPYEPSPEHYLYQPLWTLALAP